jgi:hypothetical protein
VSDRYLFQKLDHQFVCLQQSPFEWVRGFLPQTKRFLRGFWFDAFTVLRGLKKILEYRLGRPANSALLELPVGGHFCIPVHHGYRVFDLRRKAVVKLFSPHIDCRIVRAEIEKRQRVSVLGIAPLLSRWNLEERWYEEDIIYGRPAHLLGQLDPDPDTFLQLYFGEIEAYITHMILAEPPLTVPIELYLSELFNILEHRLLGQGLERILHAINSFVKPLVKKEPIAGCCHVHLVLSHGDLSLLNVLIINKRAVLIDWESLAHRNPLYDLYNYFLADGFYQPTGHGLAHKITEAIVSLQSRLNGTVPRLAQTLVSQANFYRELYYLERLTMCSERELTEEQAEIILKSIELFRHYEEEMGKAVIHS